MYRIVYDCKLKKPGCILLQAAMGGTVPNGLFYKYFPSETWLVDLTEGMKIHTITDELLPKLSAITKEKGDQG